MVTLLLDIIFAITPWALGVSFLMALFPGEPERQIGKSLVLLGIGVYLGYLITAFALYHATKFEFSIVLARTLLILSALALTLIAAHRRMSKATEKLPAQNNDWRTSYTWITCLFLVWLLTNVSFVAWENYHRPATAWDSILYWTQISAQLLSDSGSKLSPDQIALRHPLTIHLIGIWGAVNSPFNGLLFLPWLLQYVGLVLIGIGICHLLTNNLPLSFLIGAVSTSSGVMEAHAAMGGYADSWVTLALLSILATITLIHHKNERLKLPLPALLLATLVFSLIYLKLASFTLSISFLCALVAATTLRARHWAVPTLCCLIALGILAYLSLEGFNLKIFGIEASLEHKEAGAWFALDRYRGYVQSDWTEYFQNLYHSLVVNSSYSLSFLLFLGTTFLIIINLAQLKSDTALLTAYLFSLSLLIYFLFSQALSSHFLTYSSPSQDTSLSRFIQPFFFSCIATLVLLLRARFAGRNY